MRLVKTIQPRTTHVGSVYVLKYFLDFYFIVGPSLYAKVGRYGTTKGLETAFSSIASLAGDRNVCLARVCGAMSNRRPDPRETHLFRRREKQSRTVKSE